MSFSHIVRQSVETGGQVITSQNTYTGSSRVSLSETVADAQTDYSITVALDVSAVKSFYLVSDQDVTIETNDGTTPDDTLTLTAGDPYIWNTDSLDTFLLTADVTSFKVTNASGATATIQMEAILDATP